MVSVMSEYGQFRIPTPDWTRETFSEYQEILNRIAALDANLGQPDCVDPAKEAWMKAVEDRLSALESKNVGA
jgi:hypothetical protein